MVSTKMLTELPPSLLPYFLSVFILFYFIYFWLRQVLVAACGIFVEACIFRCGAWAAL